MRGGSSVRWARILGVTAVLGVSLWFLDSLTFEQEIRQGLPGGYPMPSFELPVLNPGLLEGDTTFLSSAALKGNVILLSFWATWCKPCIEEQPSLLALQSEFGADGLRVIGVLHQDRAAKALTWLKENERSEFMTVIGTTAFARKARVGGLPMTLLVDRHGQVSEAFAGYWKERDEYLREQVQQLIAD